MFGFLTTAGAALLVPTLLTPGLRTECQLDRLTYVSADDRAIGRFIAATHDYVAYGKQGAIFNDRAAEVFRFQLRISRWLHRYHAIETITDGARMGTTHHGALAAPGIVAAALPELPEELEYRVADSHLLLLDRRTGAVVDLLPDAFGEPAYPDHHPAPLAFQRALQQYVDLHRILEAGLPSLEVTSDPEQIRRAVAALARAIRSERLDARPGDVFTTEGGNMFRARIHAALERHAGDASALLCAMETDDEGGCRALTINGAFPFLSGNAMWPFLIEALPALPPELQYRFVGRDLVLLDVDAELVVDILPAALP